MDDKKISVKAAKNLLKEAGWLFCSRVKWLDDKEALKANATRDRLLQDVLPKVGTSFLGKKFHIGPLSPGCAQCVRGTWTCGFFSSQCNADCFFCPGRLLRFDKKRFLHADGLNFKKEDDFLTYLEKTDNNGVSFSGGECLLHFDRLLNAIRAVRGRFGKKIHLWIYTNGRLVDEPKLKKLRQAGLDEIRINISVDRYNLRAVRLAARFIPTVTVEIPMIPEDYDTLFQCLPRLKKAGCGYLNIHQIYATNFNYKRLAERGYTLLQGAGLTPPTFEPEIAALKLLKAASDADIGLPINYCTWEYRSQVTGWSRRRRAAVLAKKRYEDITPAGYLRRISGGTSTKNRFTVRYFQCDLKTGSGRLSVRRKQVHKEQGLTAPALKRFVKTNDFEHIHEGFPKIY
jgi:pyruvate formate-lyase activating enzyme-like uncharacterized protein